MRFVERNDWLSVKADNHRDMLAHHFLNPEDPYFRSHPGVVPEFELLQQKHVMSILLYLGEHDNVTKTEIYTIMSNTKNMKQRLIDMRDEGWIRMDSRVKQDSAVISLTEKGAEMAVSLRLLRDVIRKQD